MVVVVVVVVEVEEEGEAVVAVTWVDDPTAMPRESSILFFHAKMIAAACSAALPTIGMTMVPRKRLGTWLGSGLGLANPNPNPNPNPNQESARALMNAKLQRAFNSWLQAPPHPMKKVLARMINGPLAKVRVRVS